MVLLDTGTPGTSREMFLPSNSLLAQWLEHLVYNRGVVSSSLTIGILTENFSAGTKSSCAVDMNHISEQLNEYPKLV